MSTAFLPPVKIFVAGQNQVSAGATLDGGWVSGDVSSLGTSQTATVVFDLGAGWAQYQELNVHLFASGGTPSTFSGFTNFDASGSDTTAYDGTRRIPFLFNSGSNAQFFAAGPLAPASGDFVYRCRPVGRYAVFRVVNGDATNTAGAACRLTLAAYRG